MKNHSVLAALIAILCVITADATAHPVPDTPHGQVTKKPKSTVQLGITDEQTDETECVGIVLHIVGWKPGHEVSIQLVGPKGEKVDVAPVDKPVKIADDGIADNFISYAWDGLYPGLWILVASGTPGIHIIKVHIPEIKSITPGARSGV